MSRMIDHISSLDEDENDDSFILFWWRSVSTLAAILIVIILLYCCEKRRRHRQQIISKRHQMSRKYKIENDEEALSKKVNGFVETENTDNGEIKPRRRRVTPSSTSSASTESDIERDEKVASDRNSSRLVNTNDYIGEQDRQTISSSSSDDMEKIGSRHRTTIEIKRYKTAIVSSSTKPSTKQYYEEEEKSIDGNYVARWSGSELNKQKSIDSSCESRSLLLEKSNLYENNDQTDEQISRPRSTTDELADFAIVEMIVGQHRLDSYAAIDQTSKENNLYVDEKGDEITEFVTWRKRDESTNLQADHRRSSEKRSSVLDVTGARDVGEVLAQMKSLESVTDIIRLAGLESSHLIFGIDYTASNKHQGTISFDGESLHKVSNDKQNPYQQVISIMGKTLAPLASGGYIPAYGFGDIRTSDTSIFSLKQDGYCLSFDEVLATYNQITPKIILSGPTNFAPLIYQAMEICKEFRRYHILVIVADGQVTNESETRNAIVAACAYPLSIIVVGVGDGPWDMMRIFDEKLPVRPWDNFHFIEFYKVTHGAKDPELAFAIQALLEIPDQYKEIKAMGLLNFE